MLRHLTYFLVEDLSYSSDFISDSVSQLDFELFMSHINYYGLFSSLPIVIPQLKCLSWVRTGGRQDGAGQRQSTAGRELFSMGMSWMTTTER